MNITLRFDGGDATYTIRERSVQRAWRPTVATIETLQYRGTTYETRDAYDAVMFYLNDKPVTEAEFREATSKLPFKLSTLHDIAMSKYYHSQQDETIRF